MRCNHLRDVHIGDTYSVDDRGVRRADMYIVSDRDVRIDVGEVGYGEWTRKAAGNDGKNQEKSGNRRHMFGSTCVNVWCGKIR